MNLQITTKICSKCKQEKSISEFYKRKNKYRSECITCSNIYSKLSYLKNIEFHKIKNKSFYKNNLEYYKKYRNKNRLKIKIYKRIYDVKNKEKIRSYQNEYVFKKYKNNLLFKLKYNIRNIINQAFKFKGVKKQLHTITLLGCTTPEYQNYIKSLFKPGMVLENNNSRKWHIHHIISFKSIDLNDIKQLKKVCHYTNCIPMWADEHKEFHKIYGTKTNKEQYEDFLKIYKKVNKYIK